MSIKFKIFTYMLAFCALLLTLLWFTQVVFLESIYRSIKVSEVKNAMGTISASLSKDNLTEVADNIFKTNEIYIEIMMADGSSVYSSAKNEFGRLGMSIQEKEIFRLYRLALENGGEYLEYPNRDEGQALNTGPPRRPGNMIYYSKIIETEGAQRTVIILHAMISPVKATVGTLRSELYVITAFMLLFSVLLAFLIARRISGPIVSINESAKLLALGKYDTVFNADGYHEIKELSNTLNTAARELSKVDSLRQELIANISHDLRTPLTLIEGYAEAMRDLPGENTPENARIIVNEAKRLNRLVEDLLDLSKLREGAHSFKPVRYSLTESLREIATQLSGLTKSDGYRIVLDCDADVTITADKERISQVIYNLLINAINFTGDDKKVTMRQTVKKDSVLIEVIDTGKGISKEELPYIWDRYYRTGKNHRRAVTGTGIGLSIVKSVIEQHGGEYGVSSEPECGSVFWIKLKRGNEQINNSLR